MMLAQNPAKAYHAAIANLQKCESAYSAAMDDLDVATGQRSRDIPALRKKVAAAENALKEALLAADGAWKSYWQGRLEEIKPLLKDMAKHFRRYDAIAQLISRGFAPNRPSKVFIDGAYVDLGPMSPSELLDESGVPYQSPDSELL